MCSHDQPAKQPSLRGVGHRAQIGQFLRREEPGSYFQRTWQWSQPLAIDADVTFRRVPVDEAKAAAAAMVWWIKTKASGF